MSRDQTIRRILEDLRSSVHANIETVIIATKLDWSDMLASDSSTVTPPVSPQDEIAGDIDDLITTSAAEATLSAEDMLAIDAVAEEFSIAENALQSLPQIARPSDDIDPGLWQKALELHTLRRIISSLTREYIRQLRNETPEKGG